MVRRFPVTRRWVLAVMVVAAGCSSQSEQVLRPPASDVSLPLAFELTHALSDKAAWFEAKILRQHLTPEGLLAYRIDPARDQLTPTAIADMAIWSGVYLGAESFRQRAAPSPEAHERVGTLIGGIARLESIAGEPGVLARAIMRHDAAGAFPEMEWHASGANSDVMWMSNASVDQLDGLLFGAGAAFDALDDGPERRQLVATIDGIVGAMVEQGMTLRNVGGTRTKHGDLTCGWRTENLNCLIALSAVKVAHRVTGDARFADAYQRLVQRGYPERAVAARDRWWERWTGVNHSDNNLAFLAYYNLIRYETDPRLSALYQRSLRRAWSVVRHERNPFFTFVYHAVMPRSAWDAAALDDAKDTLLRFPTTDSRYDPDALARGCVASRLDRLNRRQACAPLPMDERPQVAVEWNQNPARIERGTRDRAAYSGFDFLVAYWLGRAHGFIPAAA
ncbi:MAG: hypothetical protein ACOYXU_02870 [Nitrospirota bacterium]